MRKAHGRRARYHEYHCRNPLQLRARLAVQKRLTTCTECNYDSCVDTDGPDRELPIGGAAPAVVVAAAPPPEPAPRSRVNRPREEAVLALLDRGQREPALQVLMTTYGPLIVGFAFRIVRDRALAEDIRQQVFIDAYRGLDTFERRGTLLGWLCRITRNRCIDALQRQRRTEPDPDMDVSTERFGSSLLAMSIDRAAQHRALQHCLGKLPAPMRALLLMRYLLGFSYEEIGAEVSAKPGTVQVRISRLLPRLRGCLRAAGVWK